PRGAMSAMKRRLLERCSSGLFHEGTRATNGTGYSTMRLRVRSTAGTPDTSSDDADDADDAYDAYGAEAVNGAARRVAPRSRPAANEGRRPRPIPRTRHQASKLPSGTARLGRCFPVRCGTEMPRS